jgi:Putative MetA-pathway of phenol degradation
MQVLMWVATGAAAMAGGPAASPDGGERRVPVETKFSLVHPRPREALRELSTDRPDQTETPYTVDAGHWQLELDLVNYTFDREAGVRTEAWNVAPINLKLGLTQNSDLQLMFDSYSVERVRAGGVTTRIRDWGDLTVRLKVNLWGNDAGLTAGALMPFVKIPLEIGDAGNDLIEGGLIVPVAFELPGGWWLGVMTEVDAVADEESNSHHAEWINSITVGHALTSKLNGYVEFFSLYSFESGADWAAQFDAGLTYAVTDDIQLDAGCNFGLTDAAPDIQPFVGVSIRF